ncbi:MAG: sugar phosphate isomerase/epimerase [Candidatus Hydrogenedentes bacterium]|nr:sugar phosphate isomerase/epimerase [Candidatus Hydrogenedentota bacterium]
MVMTPTLFSVSYAGLWGQARLDMVAFIRKAATLGFAAVELAGKRPHLSVLDTTDESLDAIKHAAEECGVEIATIAGYTDFTGGKTAAEVPFVEMQVAYVRSLARMAQRLGAKIVRVFTGYSTEADAYRADWDKCVTAIRECAAVAQEHGVTLGVQNHHDVGVAWETYAEFLDTVNHPNCRAMFDPWAPALHGDDLYACAKALAPRMVQTTLADYVRLRRFTYVPGLVNYRPQQEFVLAVPLGDGILDLEAFFRGLAEGGFSGYVAYEMCSPLRGGGSEENLDRTAKRSLEKLRGLI